MGDTSGLGGTGPRIPDDAELLRKANAGDQQAFRALVDRHARYLTAIARSMSGNDADAEDLVQETFVGALTSKFRGEAAVRTWLVQILVRRAAMLRRSKQRRLRLHEPAAGRDMDEQPSTGSVVDTSDARIDLTQMLEALSPEHRLVLVLRELEGMSYEEMAASLGVPRGTVESRLFRARAALRERFSGYFK
jgi:RNA polymerase sigma-70 factor, ECF subfamily